MKRSRQRLARFALGHSLGGAYPRVFASQHRPDLVVQLVRRIVGEARGTAP